MYLKFESISFISLLKNEEDRQKEFHVREMMEKQIIELNEDLQSLESEKNDLNEQIDDLKQQIQTKDRQIQSIQVHSISIRKQKKT